MCCLGIPTVPPPTMRPLPRPDVTPPPSGTTLLYAQGQQIGALPLNGTRMDKERSSVVLALHVRFLYSIFMHTAQYEKSLHITQTQIMTDQVPCIFIRNGQSTI